jgi:hypothetical protein
MQIILNDTDIALATEVASMRNKSQREANRPDGLVKGSSLGRDQQGALAELAVSRALNLPWDGKFMPVSVWDTWKLEGNDVGKLEIRSTDRIDGRLILHPSDKDYSPYLLVVAASISTYKLVGWILGKEGKQDCYWRDNVPRPCYMVPQNDLHSMEMLKEHYE